MSEIHTIYQLIPSNYTSYRYISIDSIIESYYYKGLLNGVYLMVSLLCILYIGAYILDYRVNIKNIKNNEDENEE